MLFILLIAISLSMDAFSLALSFGTLLIDNRKKMYISGTVGLFHFFMPILGSIFGLWFIKALHINADLLESVIFSYIAIMMFKDYKNDDRENINISFWGVLIFALGVSLDSFGIGFALNLGVVDRVISSVVFACTSLIFTFLGLCLGGKLNDLIGKYSILLGASIMGVLAFINFCQFVL